MISLGITRLWFKKYFAEPWPKAPNHEILHSLYEKVSFSSSFKSKVRLLWHPDTSGAQPWVKLIRPYTSHGAMRTDDDDIFSHSMVSS